MPHATSKEKVAVLREVTNCSVPDSHLRRVLIRCSGNLDAAAAVLITETAAAGVSFPVSDIPRSASTKPEPTTADATVSENPRSTRLVSDRRSDKNANAVDAPPGSSNRTADTPTNQKDAQICSRNAVTPETKRAAWRQFYLERRDEAIHAVGLDKKLIDKYIAQAWSDMGRSARREYICRLVGLPSPQHATAEVDPDDDRTGVVSQCGHTESPPGHAEPVSHQRRVPPNGSSHPSISVTRIESADNERTEPPHDKESHTMSEGADKFVPPLRDTSHSHPDNQSMFGSPDGKVVSNCDDHSIEKFDPDSALTSTAQRGGHERTVEGSKLCTGPSADHDDILPVAAVDENFCSEVEWPRKLTSRLCRGAMLVRGGGRNPVVAGDELMLEAPPPAKRILPGGGRGKRRPPSNSTSNPSRIVRFCKNGRELGRLAPDMGRILAPALISDLLTTTCKVVTPPETNNMFAEIILDVSICLNGDAFTPQDNGKIEGGYEDENEGDRKTQSERGIDTRRLSIVNLISSLNICELPSTNGAELAPKLNSDCEDAGVVKEGNVEAYYRTITAIDERDAKSFAQSRFLSSTLREYQKVGVKWMISREKFGNLTRVGGNHAASDFMMNPLWKKRSFPDGGFFYMNTSTGSLSLKPPPGASGGPYGGILADEMGLGKTVQCIACIVHDEEERRSLNGPKGLSEVDGTNFEEQNLSKGCDDVRMTDSACADDNQCPRISEKKVDTRNLTLSTLSTAQGSFVKEADSGRQFGGSVEASQASAAYEASILAKSESQTQCQLPCSPRRLRSRRRPPCTEGTNEEGIHLSDDGGNDNEDHRGGESDDSQYVENESPNDNGDDDGEGNDSDGDSDMVGTQRDSGRPSKRRRRLERENPLHKSRLKRFDKDENYNHEGGTENIADFDNNTPRASYKNHSCDKKSALKVLMSTARSDEGVQKGGTLIVCPTSLVTQWMNELDTHVRPRFLKVVSHYGHTRGDRRSICREAADVVVTTYGILASEFVDDAQKNGENRPSTSGPIFQVEWHRVILDEAHTIKSRVTRWAKAAYHIIAERRWCVTGTVIHNHVNDVFSLLHFLQLKPWSSWAFWNRGVAAKLEGKDAAAQKIAMSLVRDIVSSITLRRKKSTLDSLGRPIVSLTKKTVELVTLTPSPEEWDFYAALEKRSKVKFSTFLAQGKVMNNYASVLELLLRLRQACDHPYLVFAAAPSKDAQLLKDKDKLYKAFTEGGSSTQYVESILNNAENGKSQECPICLDVIEDGVAPKECGHPACRGCLVSQLRHSNKCPVCRTLISLDNVTTLPRNSRFSVDLEKKWKSSVKIETLLMEVRNRHQLRVKQGKSIGKTVIFSQFTSMLDLVQHALGREHFPTLRIDGSVPQAQRATILEKFDSEDELNAGAANILLVSLRAGGVGLNLVAASHAILLDIHWNPQVDAQAQDRIHRHGQVRDVLVRRYVIKNSVEDRLLTVQSRKQDLADGALDVATDEDKKQARLSELKLLFAS